MRISIITATYNSEATVSDTLESVLRQDYSDYEFIIKDGGSKDGTLALAEAPTASSTGLSAGSKA